MKNLERIEVPTTKSEDINAEYTTWRDGKCVSLDEGVYVTLFIDHSTTVEPVPEVQDEEPIEKSITRAYPIRVPKPVTRDMAINAAEMAKYNLKNAMEVASFNASLGRKSRINAADKEVIEHDAYIGWVKEELTKIGI